MLLSNNGALKSLDTLLVAFLDTDGSTRTVSPTFNWGLFALIMPSVIFFIASIDEFLHLFCDVHTRHIASEDRLYNDVSLPRRWLGGTNALSIIAHTPANLARGFRQKIPKFFRCCLRKGIRARETAQPGRDPPRPQQALAQVPLRWRQQPAARKSVSSEGSGSARRSRRAAPA